MKSNDASGASPRKAVTKQDLLEGLEFARKQMWELHRQLATISEDQQHEEPGTWERDGWKEDRPLQLIDTLIAAAKFEL